MIGSLQKKQYSKIICWSSSESEIVIKDQAKLQCDVLPVYFRHSKIQSFIRQLNIYGFSKQNRVGAKDKDNTYFRNDNFRRGRMQQTPYFYPKPCYGYLAYSQELKNIRRKRKGDQKQQSEPEPELTEACFQEIKKNINEVAGQIFRLRRANPGLAYEMKSVMQILHTLAGAGVLLQDIPVQSNFQSMTLVNTSNNLPNSMMMSVKQMPEIRYMDSFCSFGESLEAKI